MIHMVLRRMIYCFEFEGKIQLDKFSKLGRNIENCHACYNFNMNNINAYDIPLGLYCLHELKKDRIPHQKYIYIFTAISQRLKKYVVISLSFSLFLMTPFLSQIYISEKSKICIIILNISRLELKIMILFNSLTFTICD